MAVALSDPHDTLIDSVDHASVDEQPSKKRAPSRVTEVDSKSDVDMTTVDVERSSEAAEGSEHEGVSERETWEEQLTEESSNYAPKDVESSDSEMSDLL